MKKPETLTLRQYAKKLGTSHQTVSAAIAKKLIVEGWDIKTQKIIPHLADMEWGIDFMQKNAAKLAAKRILQDGDDDTGDDSGWDVTGDDSEISSNTKTPELIRLELLYRTRLTRLKVLKEAGTLVDKDAVYRQLFQFGQNLRQQLQALPERILDEVLASDRDAAKNIFEKELHRILELSAKYEDDFNTGNAGRDTPGAENNGI